MMQNNDLISRKALLEDLMNLEVVGGHKMYRKGCDHTLHGLVPEMINAQPAVDAAPVVHGFNTYDHNSAFQCSVCDFSDWDTMTADSGKYNYCPNCGAKMDGAKDG